MALRFRCSACSQLYRVPDSMGGRTIHCFSCGQAVIAATKNRVADDAPVDQAAGEIIINGPKSPEKSQEPESLEALGLELVDESDDAPLKMAGDNDGPLPATPGPAPVSPAKTIGPVPQKTPAHGTRPRVVVPVSRTSDNNPRQSTPAPSPKPATPHRASPERPGHSLPPRKSPAQPSGDDEAMLFNDLAALAGERTPPPAPPVSVACRESRDRHADAPARPKSQHPSAGEQPSQDPLEDLATGPVIPRPAAVVTIAAKPSGGNSGLAWMRNTGVGPFVRDMLLRNGWAWLGLAILITSGSIWILRASILPHAVVLSWVSAGCFVFSLMILSLRASNRDSKLLLLFPLLMVLNRLGSIVPVLDELRMIIMIAGVGIIIGGSLWKLFNTPREAVLRQWIFIATSAFFLTISISAVGVLMGAGKFTWAAMTGDATTTPNATPVAISTTPPSFSPRNPQMLAATVFAGTGAGGQGVSLWLYLPAAQAGQRQSVGCVFIAPAGSTCFTGMNLTPDDEAEFLPYVKAGFAVVAYNLEGPVRDTNSPTNKDVITAMKAFMAADGGLADSRMAIDYALKYVPEIDSNRLYTAGHSSAGTVALLLAASDTRIKGCVAYAPCSDLEAKLRETPALGRMVSGTADFARTHSPMKAVERLAIPVFVFHADDDETIPVSQSRELKTRSQNIQVMTVGSGGHYDSYIQQGIPAGIGWLKSRDAELAPLRSSPPSTPQPAPQPDVTAQPPIINPGPTNPVENPSPATPPRPNVTERTPPAVPDPQPAPATSVQPVEARPVTERPLPGVSPAVAPSPATPSAVVKPAQNPAPAATPLPVRPAPVVDNSPAGQLVRLGVDVKSDADDEITCVDLRRSTDVAAAARIMAGFKRVPLLRLLPSQATPDTVLALKTIPAITRFEFGDLKVADADLARIAPLSNIDELNLAGQSITSAGVRAISPMLNLKRLYLKGTKIDDAACQHLAKMTALRHLDLADTHVTSEGVDQLKTLKNLVGLVLTHTDVSDATIQNLKASNPRMNIIPP